MTWGSPHDPGQWGSVMHYRPDVPVSPNVTRRPRVRRLLVASTVVVVFALCALLLALVIGASTGLVGATLGLLFAVIPIGIVVPVFLWVDRFESEPPRLLVASFCWGALVATVGAMVLNAFGVAFFSELAIDPAVSGPVFVAPVVEETLKTAGLVALLLMRRREIDGVVDGIVYGGVIAAGFAFVENILYLGTAFIQMGSEGLLGTFIVRCLMSPFAHPMFTICAGVGLGVAAASVNWGVKLLAPLLGWVAAVLLHGLWNGAAVLAGGEGFLLLYAVVQVPLFVAFLGVLVWARRREGWLIHRHLRVYAEHGWLTPAEVAMLGSLAERRHARAWARSQGGRRGHAAMEAFQDEASELAMTRMHLHRGDRDASLPARERQLLHTMSGHRRSFVGSGAG